MDLEEEENVDAVFNDVKLENPQLVDSTVVFTTDKVFAARGDLLKWAKNVGKQNGVVVVIYRLRGLPSRDGEGWTLHVEYGMHNHNLSSILTGHSFLGRLSHEEKNLLGDMTKNMVKPRNILMTLRDHNAESLTTIKQVYNARQSFRSSIRGNRTEMQHLMWLMERDKYVYQYRKVDDSDELMDILWAHPYSITLVNKFHLVLIMDSTYKTCKYHLPLLEIVGVT
ncbi:otubain, putative [Medicago truncatula]|uniref:Otubain, putative n=1 Tax=Medicago truncatula TaxID=3880 RepID=A0A072V5E8_MEDTR|nr:otubain, putative [Medicago truncatula]